MVARRSGAVVLEMNQNVGFPKAVNAALPFVRADTLLLLNPDVIVEADTLQRCLDTLRGDPSIGIVTCNLRRPGGGPDWPAARRVRSLGTIAVEAFGFTRLSSRFNYQYFPHWDRQTSRDVPCVNGAFMMMSTALLRRVGGLDETTFLYLEDQALCAEVAGQGKRIRFVADARALHLAGASTRRGDSRQRAVAYLHLLDSDLEFVRRRQGEIARSIAIALFGIRAGAGLVLATVSDRRDNIHRYQATIRWLARQIPRRHPPPPVA